MFIDKKKFKNESDEVMFLKISNYCETQKRNNIPTIINSGLSITGNVYSSDYIEVFGTLQGDIECCVLCLRNGGFITGNIKARLIKIEGRFEGTISSQIVKMGRSAYIRGDIEYGFLYADEGVDFDGSCRQNKDLIIFNV